jgi:hypothetical protein
LAAGYFFKNLKGPHPLNFKNHIQRLKTKKCSLSISMGLLIAESQSSDTGNGLAAIVSISGISFPLQFKQICSGKPISAISQQRQAYCR